MPLYEESVRTGHKLFRWRSYIPLAFFLMLIPAYRDLPDRSHPETFSLAWELICFGISLTGLLIRSVTIGYTPLRTSGRNTKKQVADELNTSGLYSIMRNPLYMGNFFMFLGVMLYLQLWYMPLVFALVFWLYYERIILAEEDFLRNKFGDTYISWAERTPAFWPRLSGWRPSGLPFSLKMVIKREHNGLMAMTIVYSLFNLFRNRVINGDFHLDTLWQLAVGTALAFFLIIELLRRYTRVLRTGRISQKT